MAKVCSPRRVKAQGVHHNLWRQSRATRWPLVMPHDGPKMQQDGPKLSTEVTPRPTSLRRNPTMTLRCHKMALCYASRHNNPRWPKMSQDGPKLSRNHDASCYGPKQNIPSPDGLLSRVRRDWRVGGLTPAKNHGGTMVAPRKPWWEGVGWKHCS